MSRSSLDAEVARAGQTLFTYWGTFGMNGLTGLGVAEAWGGEGFWGGWEIKFSFLGILGLKKVCEGTEGTCALAVKTTTFLRSPNFLFRNSTFNQLLHHRCSGSSLTSRRLYLSFGVLLNRPSRVYGASRTKIVGAPDSLPRP